MPRRTWVAGAAAAAAAWTGAGETADLKRVVTSEKPIAKLAGEFKTGTLTISPDGRRFAWARKEGSSYVVEVDGKPAGTYKMVGMFASLQLSASAKSGVLELPGFKPMIFSGDSQHLAFSAFREKKKWVVVHDGRESKPYEWLAGGPVLSHDGQRLAFAGKAGGSWRVVVDGVDGKPYEKVGPPVFSADGKRFAHVARQAGKEMMVTDGVESKPFESLDVVSGLGAALAFPDLVAALPTFSPDGRLAFHGKRAGRWYVVVDGEEGDAFDEVGDIAFSPDGKRLAFPARRAGLWTLIVDGTTQGSYKKVSAPFFSPDGSRLAYVGESETGQVLVVEGKPLATHEGIGVPRFSHDGRRLAYPARTGKQWMAVIDGVAQKPYSAVLTPVFSPDGSHVAYEAALAEGRWTVVLDGIEGKFHQGLVRGAQVVFDGNDRLHYMVVHQDQVVLVDEELRSGP